MLVGDAGRERFVAVVRKGRVGVRIAAQLGMITANSIEFVLLQSLDLKRSVLTLQQVSAEDMVFKDNFSYDALVQRAALPLRSSNWYAPSYSPSTGMLPLGSSVPYRQNIDYHYNDQAAAYNSHYAVEFPEESQDYSNMSYYQGLHHPHESVDMSYNTVPLPPQRSWTPVPLPSQKPTLASPFYEQSYAQPSQHHQVPHYQPYTVPLRSSISSEGANFNLAGMSNNLPVSSRLTSHERVLPIPSSGPIQKYADPMGYSGPILPSNGGTMPLSVKPLNSGVVGLSHLDTMQDPSQTHGATYDQSFRSVEEDSDATPVSLRSRNEF